jgi:hypothetical protein
MVVASHSSVTKVITLQPDELLHITTTNVTFYDKYVMTLVGIVIILLCL